MKLEGILLSKVSQACLLIAESEKINPLEEMQEWCYKGPEGKRNGNKMLKVQKLLTKTEQLLESGSTIH